MIDWIVRLMLADDEGWVPALVVGVVVAGLCLIVAVAALRGARVIP